MNHKSIGELETIRDDLVQLLYQIGGGIKKDYNLENLKIERKQENRG